MSRVDLIDNTLQSQKGNAPSALSFKKHIKRVEGSDDLLRRPSISYWKDAWLRFKKNKIAMISAAYILCLLVASIVFPQFSYYSFDSQEIWNKHALPNLGYQAIVVDNHVHADIEGDVNAAAPLADSPQVGGEDVASVPTNEADNAEALVEPPPAPANVKIIGEALTTKIQLSWDAVKGVDGYRIYRSITKDTAGIPLADVPANTLIFVDQSSLLPETYHYTVTAFNAFGDSLSSGSEVQMLTVKPKLALTLEDALLLDPNARVGASIKTKPHYLGTDYLGRDMLTRLMMGARISLLIGFCSPFLYMLIGIIYGSISGYFGGIVDDIMMRVADIVFTIPYLLVVIMLQVVLGSGLLTLIIAMVATSWAGSARQVRGQILQVREAEFVHAAEVLGTPVHKIIARHLLPNVMGTILVLFTLAIPQAIFTEAFLSFIGLGIAPPMASWGTVTRDGARVFLTYPFELIIPATLMCITILGFNLLGDGLRDALDPKLRGTQS